MYASVRKRGVGLLKISKINMKKFLTLNILADIISTKGRYRRRIVTGDAGKTEFYDMDRIIHFVSWNLVFLFGILMQIRRTICGLKK